jgi:undecaprenyl-diphosphatase
MGWRELVLLLAIGTITASLWIFISITDGVVTQKEYRGMDKNILLAFRTPDDLSRPIGPAWVKAVSLDISSLGSASVLTLITLLICGYLFLERKFAAAFLIIFAAVSGTLLNQMLKDVVGRERPQIVPHLAEISNSSFPSGHSMLSSIIYLTLAVLLTQTVKTWPTKMYLVGSAFMLAFLVGLTRVIIGVHYPSDVLGGWTAGTAWAILCWMGAKWLNRRGALR